MIICTVGFLQNIGLKLKAVLSRVNDVIPSLPRHSHNAVSLSVLKETAIFENKVTSAVQTRRILVQIFKYIKFHVCRSYIFGQARFD